MDDISGSNSQPFKNSALAHHPSSSSKPMKISISVNGHVIAPSSSVKYLGDTISSSLSWSEHITMDNIIHDITSTCNGYINRRFSQSSQRVRAQLYRSAVLPKLDYCGSVWDPHHQSDISALEGVQKFAARITTQQWKADYPTLTSTLNWEPLSLRRKVQKLKVCFNILNNLSIIPPDTFIPHPHPVTYIIKHFLDPLYTPTHTDHLFLSPS